jgi:ATP-dependent Clp protease protease subunit
MRKIVSRDWVDAYFNYGVDKNNRRIFLDGELDTESSSYIRRSILYLDSINHDQPIELWICSEGGDEYAMFSIYDTLRTVRCPIHTIATGMCMSAAPLLVAAGEASQRYATPNSWFMVHQSWDDFGEARIDERKKVIAHYESLAERWYELMALHTKHDAKFWKKLCSSVGDSYFSADMAVEYGLVDHIWSEKE